MATCVLLTEIAPSARAQVLAEAGEIFFETSNTRAFASAAARELFHNRWFGHYVDAQPETFLLAKDGDGAVSGYVAGCIDSFSEAAEIITQNIFYYTPAFRAAMAGYPSHFHINVKPSHQRSGLGRMLTGCFVDLCGKAGSPGIHVVTHDTSPAVKFYEAYGFKNLPRVPAANSDLAVLGCITGAPQRGQTAI